MAGTLATTSATIHAATMRPPISLLVSVIVPTYNRLHLLKATVASLAAQRLESCEFLMIDDRSQPETVDYLQSLPRKDSRFRIILKHSDNPSGCQVSRNLGIAESRAEWVLFLDSDDLLAPSCLLQRLDALDHLHSADILIGNQAIFHESSRQSHWVNIPKPAISDLDRFLHLIHPLDVPWVNGGCIIRRDALLSRGIQWPLDVHWDDVWFHSACLISGLKTRWLPRTSEPDSWYRVHGKEHYGSTLHSDEGYTNSVKMILDLTDTLHRQQLTSPDRLERISHFLFHYAFLRLLDRKNFSAVHDLLAQCREKKLFPRSHWKNLKFYVKLRQISCLSRKATYYVNRLARSRLLPVAFKAVDSTYASIPCPAPDTTLLNPFCES